MHAGRALRKHSKKLNALRFKGQIFVDKRESSGAHTRAFTSEEVFPGRRHNQLWNNSYVAPVSPFSLLFTSFSLFNRYLSFNEQRVDVISSHHLTLSQAPRKLISTQKARQMTWKGAVGSAVYMPGIGLPSNFRNLFFLLRHSRVPAARRRGGRTCRPACRCFLFCFLA